jgi:hypothetical protein
MTAFARFLNVRSLLSRAFVAMPLALLLTPSAAAAAGDGVVLPVPSIPTLAAKYVGKPATARPIDGVPVTPQNPYMAPNGRSSIHNDGWQTDVYRTAGPLGVRPITKSASIGGVCGSIAFDSRGRIVSACIGVWRGLYLIDPKTLDTIAEYRLPSPPVASRLEGNLFKSFDGGGYFYLDSEDRAVVGTADGHILVVGQNAAHDAFVLVKDIDLSGLLADGEVLNSALPATDGTIWFVAKKNGVVGTLDLSTGHAEVIRLGQGAEGQIENSMAVGSDGEAYIATNRKLYRFEKGPGGVPTIAWEVQYPNSGQVKSGQVDDGTGTTPTVLPGGYVAITDNADPMQVVVYRTANKAKKRQVCAIPVFTKGASSTENSLIGAGRSLIVENNYGYDGPQSVLGGATTKPGFERIDINKDGTGCRTVWRNATTAAPSVVPKLSLATGLVYVYTKGADPTDPWYWTALDFRTGKEVWRILAGAGPALNNNYAGVSLAPDGTAYLGVITGLIALRDGT